MKYLSLVLIVTQLYVCSAYSKHEMANFEYMKNLVAAKKAIAALHGKKIKDAKKTGDHKKAKGSRDFAVARDLILNNKNGKYKGHVEFVPTAAEKAAAKQDEGLKNYQAAKDLTIATHLIKSGQLNRDIAAANSKNATEVLGEIGTGLDDFIYGFINGLLDANLTTELKECGTWKNNAERGFNDAWDQIQQGLDIWVGATARLTFFKSAFLEMVNVVPGVIKDLGKCSKLADHAAKLAAWGAKVHDIMYMLSNLGSNLLANGFKIAALAISIPIKAASMQWFGLGFDIGNLTHNLLKLPPSTHHTGSG